MGGAEIRACSSCRVKAVLSEPVSLNRFERWSFSKGSCVKFRA